MTLTGNLREIDWLAADAIGWAGLLTGLRHRLDGLDVEIHVDQVKEKFGGLRFYVTLPDEATDPDARYVNEWIESAENASYLLCYLCGAGVTHQGTGHWVRYFCAEHDTTDLFAKRGRFTKSESAPTPPGEVAQSPETEH